MREPQTRLWSHAYRVWARALVLALVRVLVLVLVLARVLVLELVLVILTKSTSTVPPGPTRCDSDDYNTVNENLRNNMRGHRVNHNAINITGWRYDQSKS